jgi:hypothetical protein
MLHETLVIGGNMKKIIFVLAISLLINTGITNTSWASSITLPQNFLELQGAYKGRGVNSHKDAYLLIYKIMEDNQPSGRFNMFLLTNDKAQGQILEAESIGGTGIAVLVDGVSDDKKYIEATLPPAGVLELALDKKYGQYLRLTKSDDSSLLQESYAFTEDSRDIRINPNYPTGLFSGRRGDTLAGISGASGILNVDAQVSSLDFSGKFVGIFELTGVMVLRKQKLDNSLYQYNEGEISGLLVSIYNGRKPMVIVGRLTDGKPAPVAVLPLD